MHMSRIIPNTITKLAKNEHAQLNEGAKEHVREFIYISDLLEAIITVARKGKPGEVYCCGGTEHIEIGELIRKICIMMGKDPGKDIEIKPRATNFKEIKEQYIDSTKLRSLGWMPKITLEEGLEKTINFYSELVRKRD